MSAENLNVFMPVVIFMLLAFLIVTLAIIFSKVIRPFKPNKTKEAPYECGEVPQGSAWSQFNVRFYVVGLIFIIFDVESALMFPVASIFRKFNELGRGGVVLVEIFIFLGILMGGIAYCWSKGDLDWVKSYQSFNNTKKNLKKYPNI